MTYDENSTVLKVKINNEKCLETFKFYNMDMEELFSKTGDRCREGIADIITLIDCECSSVDWGDGIVNRGDLTDGKFQHIYVKEGEYIIEIKDCKKYEVYDYRKYVYEQRMLYYIIEIIQIGKLQTNIGGFNHLNNIKHLDLTLHDDIKTINNGFCCSCPKLETVNLVLGKNITKIYSICEYCPNLKSIDITFNSIPDIIDEYNWFQRFNKVKPRISFDESLGIENILEYIEYISS